MCVSTGKDGSEVGRPTLTAPRASEHTCGRRKAHLQLFHDHEAQEPVQAVQPESPQRGLDFGEEAAAGHFLMSFQVIPSVQLVNVTCHSETKTEHTPNPRQLRTHR